MIYARAHEHDYEAEAPHVTLPEHLGAEGVRLLIADAIVALVLAVASGALNEVRGGWLSVLTILLCAALLGRYRQTFAATAHDEWYATWTVSLVAAISLVVLVPLFAVSWWIAAAILIVWSIVGAIAAGALTQHRRGKEQAVATTSFLTAISRRRARNPIVRSTIALMDFVLAAVLTVVLSPVLLLCAIAVAMERDGPVLFLQHRVGVDGREFRMFKFRTMKVGAGNEWANEDDDRITKIGRFMRRTSLDELPQLWNVLRGEMSLVGPRPEMSEYADHFVRTVPYYEDRQAIPPGITGWAQIQYDRNFAPAEFENVLPYDLFYVANYSVSLYLFCLIKTVFEVLRHRAV
jgi:lipopolysaccharide/colanic/teichoic acid biosynthesis glycosyltransferase